MISEERLRELVDRPTIYYYSKGVLREVKNWIMTNSGCIYDTTTQPDLLLYENLYETKKEAEFVARYHCEKTIKFEPPTFEEFIKAWSYKFGAINKILYWETYKCFTVECENITIKKFNYTDTSDKQQAYYQAVEYVKKLFLGEE